MGFTWNLKWALLLVFVSVSQGLSIAAQGDRPNIVLVLADDMGYGDVQAFNPDSKIATKHIDALAKAGMRFTDAHAPAAVCIPTRYGLLTGRYPHRADLRINKPVIEPDRLTLPAYLRQQGYETSCIGKWHLGFDNLRQP